MDETIYMRRSIELAQRARGCTAPNPMVGAVLVHDGRVIGEGWHHRYGADHAEVNCLKNVAEADRPLIPESAMYMSLEPCAHQGITPPCAHRLVAEKIKKVVIANTDPFEQVNGRGIEILEKGGIEVVTGMLAGEGLWVNRRFFCFHKQQRPYIILKWAQTQNGFMAPADRSRFQITGPESRLLVHKWRTEEGAVMVGYNTALHDDPELTARLWPGRQPLRIAIDRHLRLPPAHHLFDNAAATWIINEDRETLHGNIRSIQLKFDGALPARILRRLYDARILSVIIEGGAALLTSFIAAGLWDEARIFTGQAVLHDGIRSPVLTDAVPAFSTAIAGDLLQVSVHKDSAYPYIHGMSL